VGGGTYLLLDNEDLGGNRLDLGDDAGLDELAEVGTTKVQQTGLEEGVLEVELLEVEATEDAELGNSGQIEELLDLEDAVEVQNVVVDVEEVVELVEAEVLVQSELLENVEGIEAVVEAKDVVDVGGGEAGEATAEEVIEAALLNLLLSRGRSDQGGEGRNNNGGGLHLDGCVSE
jgi:hypothetical protein